jgi:hypothetical protein
VQTARSPSAHRETAIAFGIESKEKSGKGGTPCTLQGAGKVPVQVEKTNVQTNTSRAKQVATARSLYLALLINVAELAQIHTKSRITAQHHSKEIVLSIARQMRCEQHKRSTKTTRRRVEE